MHITDTYHVVLAYVLALLPEVDTYSLQPIIENETLVCPAIDLGNMLVKEFVVVRIRGYVRGDVNDWSDHRQPGYRRAATDYQRLDPDAEKGHWRFGVVQPELGDIS